MMTEREIAAILFDLDGVLINSLESWYQALIMPMQKIKESKGIQKQIERIKEHEWVKVVEEDKK